jgi:hypothetical protein
MDKVQKPSNSDSRSWFVCYCYFFLFKTFYVLRLLDTRTGWIHTAQNKNQRQAVVNVVTNIRFHCNPGNFLSSWKVFRC